MICWLILTALQTAKVTIPCGTYSLPEAAKLLSTRGLQVEVSANLKERGLLISMHDRPQKEALEILCKGLDLRVVKEGASRKRLELDPDATKRESRWREGFLKNLTRRWVVQEEHFMRLVRLDAEHLQTAKQETKLRADLSAVT